MGFKRPSSGLLTVVALGNAVLDTAPFSKIRDLSPVLIGICMGTEGAAGRLRPSASGDGRQQGLGTVHCGCM